MFKLKYFSLMFLFLLLCSCSSARTAMQADSSLKPFLIEGTHAQATEIIYLAAQKAFPNEPCDRDDKNGVIKINRNWFWRGDTLVTVSLTGNRANRWAVHVISEGVGYNQPAFHVSTREVNLYLAELHAVYEDFKKKQKAPEPAAKPANLSGKLLELQSAFDKGLISKDEFQQKRQEILRDF